MRSPAVIRRVDRYHDLLPLHATYPTHYPHLIESVVHGTEQSRYDILFAFPGHQLTLSNVHQLHSSDHCFPLDGDDFLANLDRWWHRDHLYGSAVSEHSDLPFCGGWFVYLSYELAGQIEPTLRLPHQRSALPMALAVRIPAAVIRDHQRGCLWLMAEVGHEPLLERMEQHLRTLPPDSSERAVSDAPPDNHRLREDDGERYLRDVETIKRYITEGDVFQVNLSRAWRGNADVGQTVAIYRRLRRHNPAPFAALMTLAGAAVMSSSPERLAQVRGGRVETRPIAGTRPRGRNRRDDDELSRTLLAHPKERAEHIMLIDLERNDLGRVCVPGSVNVGELMVLESYAHVHHIVSSVTGRLRRGVTPGAVIRALFPGGTITGCPKVRCMEIIAELEQEPRGAYTGSLGYINRDGSMDFNILIRTICLDNGQLLFRAGAGIVADSVAEHELKETRAKARGLNLALNDGKTL